MAEEESSTLYEDKEIKICQITGQLDGYRLFLGDQENGYYLSREGFRDLATSSRDKFPGELRRVNHHIIFGFSDHKIIPEAIEIALSQAYIEETRRIIERSSQDLSSRL